MSTPEQRPATSRALQQNLALALGVVTGLVGLLGMVRLIEFFDVWVDV